MFYPRMDNYSETGNHHNPLELRSEPGMPGPTVLVGSTVGHDMGVVYPQETSLSLQQRADERLRSRFEGEPIQACVVGARLRQFVQVWAKHIGNPWVLHTITEGHS